ncbi:Endonuclease 8 1 [Stieleria bergensis]|uniref:DNA-(apurinic or apyrimidinic site) lyase n=1 Tax=Stieleria bergensis TaxID=2528025 RepID=A0A517T1T1_9BACT|nr:Endonuclease 8 1 [Planctomycetes bacterium SV_7m_r]
MPEGHTIHRIARDHTNWFANQKLRVSSPQGRFHDEAAVLSGQMLHTVEAHGKHLFYHWAKQILHVHLGLYGKFRRHSSPPPEPRGLVRLRAVGKEHAFDLNGPNTCELITATQLEKLRERLGEDPLRTDAVPSRAWTKLQRSKTPIGQQLLNQSIIAGVGNIYRCEVMFLLGIHPKCASKSISSSTFEELWELLVELLNIGVDYNKIIIPKNGKRSQLKKKAFGDERLLVYKKDRCPRCGTAIIEQPIGARKCYWCPKCQAL